ncbi:MAG: NapC/NirT family cytochrome c [Firmicutes bacterium]|nr:NapC/NirT family cytochrome c [Bacillota bacterium]
MGLTERFLTWLRPAVYLGNNTLSLLGAVLTTSAAVTMLGFWAFELFGHGHVHPYLGIIVFLILPGIFVLGLVLIPVGAFWRRYKLRVAGLLPDVYPHVDFREPMLRRAAGLVATATVLNIAILGTASYRGVTYMDSVQFCGQTCHNVMEPEFTAYRNSPHARVACVDCHIGPGAPWFVRSKLSGVRQVFAVAFDTYNRPIPTPVRELRPARETCEQCHWPTKFHGDKFLVRTRYSDDEQNTPRTTVLVLKIGGRTWQGSVGIHGRHFDERERVTYITTDDRRQVIPWVSYVDDEGKLVEYTAQDVSVTALELARGERRTMDCMDCHNRPTHIFELPDRAVDEAITEGRISRQLPFVKKKAVELLTADYPDKSTALAQIYAGLTTFYSENYPEVYRQHRAWVELAAQQVRAIYDRNVFPHMKVSWGTYPNNLGHMDFLGCFRCHGGSHRSADGRVINPDCTACHSILAMDDPNPEILQQLGIGTP